MKIGPCTMSITLGDDVTREIFGTLHYKPIRTKWRQRLGVAAFNKAEGAANAAYMFPDEATARVWSHLAGVYRGIQRRCGL